MNLNYDTKNKNIILRGHYSALIDMLKQVPKIPNNVENQRRVLDRNVSNFCGGSLEDALSNADMTPFNDALADLKKNRALAFLKPDTANVSQSRKRVKSEHEGDYDLDRRWDIQPFNATKRILSPVQHITIDANLTVSGMYDAHQVNAYGALVWAVVQYLESKNIRVTLNAVDLTKYHESQKYFSDMKMTVKEPTKYVSPQSLANVFRCVFYRRVFFNASIIISDKYEKEPGSSLGRPMEYPIVEYKDYVLKLSIGALNDTDGVARELQKIFGKVS